MQADRDVAFSEIGLRTVDHFQVIRKLVIRCIDQLFILLKEVL